MLSIDLNVRIDFDASVKGAHVVPAESAMLSGVQVTLVKEKVATSPQSVATFVYTWGGRREFEVRKDQEFSLKPVEEITYKLVDVQPNKAVIVNTQKPNARIEIGFAPP